MTPDDPQSPLAIYRKEARRYDRRAAWPTLVSRLRKEAIARLELAAGDTVIDVGCGTGASFAALQERIGPRGQLIGVDASPEMLARADARVLTAGWQNVQLRRSAIEDAEFEIQAEAALFFLTHDILRSPQAVAKVTTALAPGAAVAIVGAKTGPPWSFVTNLVVRRAVKRYASTLEGLEHPWSHMAEHVPDLRIRSAVLGGAYLAWGRLSG
jgi:ubiquinone/menaquinone biosynthesis C-methylase UbiE